MEKQIKFINKAKVIHNSKYDYSKTMFNGIKNKIKIICPIHGEFEQTPHHHVTRKQGCPKCRYTNISKKTRGCVKSFINKAKLIHGDKYDYSLVEYVNRKTKVKIICQIHGIFEQEPHNHINGQECGKCHGLHKTSVDFITQAKLIHGDKYGYSLVEYVNRKTKVKIICTKHGEFKQLSYAHLFGQGCPKCTGLNKTTDEFISDAKLIHNNKYNYSLVNYKSSKKKIIIKCYKHGEFEQIPNDHLRGKGCPICRESKGEEEIRQYLIENKIKYIKQYTFNGCKNINKLPFDFYLPDYNTCIEYDGIQHFKPIEHFGGNIGFLKLKQNDSIKANFCLKNNISLIRISYKCNIYDLLSKILVIS